MSADNPYQAPSAEILEHSTEPDRYRPASHGKRFLTWLIDYAARMGCAVGVVAVIMLSNPSLIKDAKDDAGYHEAPRRSVAGEFGSDLLMGAGVAVGYYTLLEALCGRTLGKLVMGTKVVRKDYSRPGFWQILGRSLCRLIPFETLSILGGERMWHDRLSGTMVVDVRAAKLPPRRPYVPGQRPVIVRHPAAPLVARNPRPVHNLIRPQTPPAPPSDPAQ